MRKKEFIAFAIRQYTKAIDWAERSRCSSTRLLDYLYMRRMHRGLCTLAAANGIHSSKCKWIHRYLGMYVSPNEGISQQWIALPPNLASSKGEMVRSLKYRLTVLKKERRRDLLRSKKNSKK